MFVSRNRERVTIAASQNTKERDFWLNKLAKNWERSHFPYDHDNRESSRVKHETDSVEFRFSNDMFAKLSKMSGSSLRRVNMILVAALLILIRKYSGNHDIIVGSPIYKQDVEGEFVNTVLPLRSHIKDSMTFKELVLEVRQIISEAAEHQDYPIEMLLKRLHLPVLENGDFPLFDITTLLENIHDKAYIRHIHTNVNFSFLSGENHLDGLLEYNPLRYEKATIERMAGHFKRILQQVLTRPGSRVSDVDMMTGAEKKQLLFDFNDTYAEFPRHKTIHQLFEEQVEMSPDHTALVFGEESVTYKTVNRKANDLAAALREKGVKPDTIVAVLMDSSLEMVFGILAVLKAGGAYLPVNPGYPETFISELLNDSGAPWLLTRQEVLKRFSFVQLQDFENHRHALYISPPRPQVTDLDRLQIPDRSLVDYEKYHAFIGQAMMKNDITLQFSRGCVYRCAYCFKIWPDRYIARSAENMFEEINLYYQMGIRRFAFVDDLPNLNVEVGKKLYRLIIKNGLKVHLHYVNGIRADLLTKDYIDLMVEAGTVVMDLALETTSGRLQKLIKKNLNLEKFHENIQYIMKTYPHVVLETAILHGIPTETEAEAQATLEYMKQLKWIHFPYIHIMKIYPNTDMAAIALEKGVSKEAIAGSAGLAYHELPDTLPFPKPFTLQYQAEFLSDYFLCKERLLSTLPALMKVLTEDELVRAYDGYLPAKINSLADFLDYTGLSREELPGQFLAEDFGAVPNFNERLKNHFPVKQPAESALKILLLDLSQYFTLESDLVYDVVEPPLGLMYLLGHLQRNLGDKIEGKIAKSRIDFDNFADLKDLVIDFNPDVIGIRTLNYHRDFFHKTISILRQWGVAVPVIAGGPYATSSYRTLLKDSHIDLAVLGEGEITFLEIIEKMIENNKKLPDQDTLEKIPGIAFMENRGKMPHPQKNREILVLEETAALFNRPTAGNPVKINNAADLAYIIYTSGSTGIPKGVMVQHRSLVNQVSGLQRRFGLDASFNYLLLASFTFDVSVMHIFLPLTTGAKLFLIPAEVKKDPTRLWQFIYQKNIDILNIVPAYMKALLENVEKKKIHFKYLFVGGDVFHRSLYHTLAETFAVEKDILNIYGPTETTINATLYPCCGRSRGDTIPIGKPVTNYRAYVLDKNLNPVPTGIPGELCIAGEGVARGYLNREELTAEKFIVSPHVRYERMYRTGDLVRRLPDGNIEFLGRMDDQVKIRGFRIEPGEIERRLSGHHAVAEAVVIAKEDGEKNKSLIAYYVKKKKNEPELWPSIGEYFIWDELMYYAMTHDERRNKRFKAAVNKLVKDKTVVEVGTGQDAILARFCVEAGAKKVYAIELLDEYCKKAEETVKKLGLTEKIVLIQGDVRNVELPEKVDICLANQCGTIGSSEGAIILHNNARRFLKEESRVIPHKCITKIAAVTLPDSLHENPGFSELTGNYAEKIFAAFDGPFDLRLCVKNFPASNVISNAAVFEHLDFSGLIEHDSIATFDLTVDKKARINGFLLWLNLYTMEGELIDTLKDEYVWLPLFVPVFYPGIEVSEGDSIKAQVGRTLADNGLSPDYTIKGELIKGDGETTGFEYDMSRLRPADDADPFYRKLFNSASVNYRVSGNTQADVPGLREYLARELPDYMVPSHFVQMDKIPLNANGKVDRDSLPVPEIKVGGEYIPPASDLDKVLVEIWSEILQVNPAKISVNSSFFDLGGHSLKATILIARTLKRLNVKIPLIEFFKAPTIVGLREYINGAVEDEFAGIKAAEKKEYYPLSPAQKRLYVLRQMEPGTTTYNMPAILRLGQEINREKLEKTFRKLIQRHESLRTSFEMVEEVPVQKITEDAAFFVDASTAAEHELEETVRNFIKPFDPAKPPLLRAALVTVKPRGNFILLVDMDHIITDGISTQVFMEEFKAVYEGKELQPNRIQYKDFCQWLTDILSSGKLKNQETFWLKEFQGEVPVLELPTDYPRPAIQSFAGHTIEFSVGPRETSVLTTMASKQGVTPFMVFLSLYDVFLSRLTGQDDIIVGTPVAGRRHADLEQVIGVFVNTLALRNVPARTKTYLEFLQELKDKTLDAFENQEYPFEELVEKTAVNRDISRNPMFDAFITFRDNTAGTEPATDPAPGTTGARQKPTDYTVHISKFDLSLHITRWEETLLMAFEYCTKLFKKETVERFISYFRQLIRTIPANPHILLAKIDLLPEQERKKILLDFNRTGIEYPRDKTIHRLFEEQVEQATDHIALVYEEEQVTYGELNKRSNQLARQLRRQGVKSGTLAGITAGRSIEMMTGITGILKAGGAYVPIDPGYPQKRKEYILEASAAGVLLVSGTDSLSDSFGHAGVIDVGDVQNYREEGSNLPAVNTAADLAYVIFTSGSTGRPKGVKIEHRSVVNFIKGITDIIFFGEQDTILSLTTVSFDIFGLETLLPLTRGSKIVIGSVIQQMEPGAAASVIDKEQVTIFQLTPSRLQLLLADGSAQESLKHLKYLLVGGEPFPEPLLESLRRFTSGQIYNLYGPTETTIWSTVKNLTGHKALNIGKPIANTRIYILGTGGELQPIGVAGELCIAGDGVAQGYFKNPGLTKEKFVPDPFNPGGNMYKTGDLAKWLADGNIECLGRSDHQVKLRGFRIELGEIEYQLRKIPEVNDAVVLLNRDENGDNYLCAYIVSETELALPRLRTLLAEELPDYMIPAHFVSLEKIPLTPNGKIDRSALPKPEVTGENQYEPPGDKLEEKLVEIMSEVLSRDSAPSRPAIGIHDNFFRLGGHSLKAVGMISRLHKELNVRVPLTQVFKDPTPRGLAKYIRGRQTEAFTAIGPAEKKEFYPLSYPQRRLFFLQQMDPASTAYNMPLLILLEQAPDMEKLERAFRLLIKRHESLRTSFKIIDDEPRQQISEDTAFEIPLLAVGHNLREEQGVTIETFIRPFDLAQAPLMRAALMNSGNSYMLMVDMHHIISDETSHFILQGDFNALYRGEELAPLKIHYKDYIQWKNSPAQEQSMKQAENYWLGLFKETFPRLNLPLDYDRADMTGFEGDILYSRMQREQGKKVLHLVSRENTTLYMVMLAVYNIFLSKICCQEDVVIGASVSGRNHADTESVIGLFLNTLVLINRVDEEKSFRDFLKEVETSSLQAFENQDYQFEELVKTLNLDRDPRRNPLFDAVFALRRPGRDHHIGTDREAQESSCLQAGEQEPLPKVKRISKFDLIFQAIETPDHLLFSFEYRIRLFKKETIRTFLKYVDDILSQILKDPGKKIKEIELEHDLAVAEPGFRQDEAADFGF